VDKGGGVLVKSLARIREAIKKGEPTGYFSGGQPHAEVEDDDSDE
jgi:hypothetical protein